ncbi:MAG: DUF4347 domain-containing protein [Alphaproteobacteria bacterium]
MDAVTHDLQTNIFDSDEMPKASGESDSSTLSSDLVDALGNFATDPNGPAEVVFVDRSIDDLATFVASIESSYEVILLDTDRDGVEQIAEVLSTRSDVDAIHIVSHGNQAELFLGTASLTSESMNERYKEELAVINQALSEEADILIYGCDFGEGKAGLEAAALLAELTGADVAASTDDTGHADLGGDWDLELTVGEIETSMAVSEEAQGTWMATLAVNNISVAVTDNVNTDDDTPLILDPTTNDTDTEGDPVNVVEFTQPSNGTVIDNGDGTLTYTPTGGYSGPDGFDYVAIDDGAGLEHYWAFDGDAADYVGSADGTITGTTNVAGDFGDALSFDGVDDKIVVSDFAYNSDFTISFEFKIDDNTGSLFQYIYSHGSINGTNSLNIFINESTHGTDPNKLRTIVRDFDDTLDNTALEFDASGLIGDGLWHTYTLTVSSTDGAKVFLDGALQNSDATRGTDSFDPGTDLFLGAREDLSSDRFFGSSLDSVQIYNTALSSGEVSDLDARTNRATVNITVNDVNDDPFDAGSLPSDVAVTEDVASPVDLSTIDLADADAGGGSLTVTLTTATGGEISAAAGAGITVGGTSTARTLSGTLADLNTYLDNAANLTYLHATPGTSGNDADSIQVAVSDNGNTGSGGGGQVNLGTVNVDISAVNNAPVNTVPGPQSVPEETATAITGISIADSDAGGADLTTRLQVASGVLTVTLSGSAVISAGASGSGDLTIRGSATDINATLASLTYQGDTDVTGIAADSLTVTTDDLGNSGSGGAQQDVDVVQIDITPLNDAPVKTVPDDEDEDEESSIPTFDLPVDSNPDGMPIDHPIVPPGPPVVAEADTDYTEIAIDEVSTTEIDLENFPAIELAGEPRLENEIQIVASKFSQVTNNKPGYEASRSVIDLGLGDPNIAEFYSSLDQFDQDMSDGESIGGISLSQISLGASAAMTAGYAMWATRGSVLLSTFLSTMPAWRRFDPLIIITKRKKEKINENKKISDLFSNARRAK